ncbi:MAG: PTS glucitol/sorbitol transporter subunit IIA [Brachybacterium sp.]|nr:PTS glucitol/sorbitol transporter subunit IIA [Brachybacterium sp.]
MTDTRTLWTAEITSIGPDATDMIDAGVLILFGEPVPPALADVSVVHRADAEPARDLAPGDTLRIGEAEFILEAVGEQASQNLRDLGHVVLYVDAAGQNLLPGAVHATGTLTAPEPGQTITLLGP